MDGGFLQIDKEGRRRLTPEGEAMLSQEDDPCCCEPGGGTVGCSTMAHDGGTSEIDGTGICEECGPDRTLPEKVDKLPEGSGRGDRWISGPNYTPVGWWVETSGLTTCGCVEDQVNGDELDTLFEISDGENCALIHNTMGCNWSFKPYGPGGEFGNPNIPGNLRITFNLPTKNGTCGGGSDFTQLSAVQWRMKKEEGEFTLEGIVPWFAAVNFAAFKGLNPDGDPLRIFFAKAEGDPKGGCRRVTFTNEYKDEPEKCAVWDGVGRYPIIGREGTVIVKRCCPPRS